jgi:hypothetical protein
LEERMPDKTDSLTWEFLPLKAVYNNIIYRCKCLWFCEGWYEIVKHRKDFTSVRLPA